MTQKKGKVRALFISLDMDLIDSHQTYSYDANGCGQIFTRARDLTKYKVWTCQNARTWMGLRARSAIQVRAGTKTHPSMGISVL